MRPVIFGAVLLAALCAAIASCHVPSAGLQLRTFRKVSDAEFAVMREEAARFVREGQVLDTRYPGERYFEVSCHGVPVMLVDNSLEQLVIVLYADRETNFPCVVPVLSHWSSKIVPEWWFSAVDAYESDHSTAHRPIDSMRHSCVVASDSFVCGTLLKRASPYAPLSGRALERQRPSVESRLCGFRMGATSGMPAGGDSCLLTQQYGPMAVQVLDMRCRERNGGGF